MTTMTLSKAAQALGIPRYTMRDRVRHGLLPALQVVPMGGKRPLWMVDLDDARAHFAERPLSLKATRLPDAIYIPPAPDGLNMVQRSVLDSEHWHILIECLPDRRFGPGAFRCAWSDGESYTLLPNGEMERFRYLGLPSPQEER